MCTTKAFVFLDSEISIMSSTEVQCICDLGYIFLGLRDKWQMNSPEKALSFNVHKMISNNEWCCLWIFLS